MVVRSTEDGRPVHRAVVRSTVEEAAGRIQKALEREAAEREGRD